MPSKPKIYRGHKILGWLFAELSLKNQGFSRKIRLSPALPPQGVLPCESHAHTGHAPYRDLTRCEKIISRIL